jgi:hypothetical protein
MRFFTAVFAVATLAVPAFASPTAMQDVRKYSGETTGRYIVKLKDNADKGNLLANFKNAKVRVTHEWDLLHGFAGLFCCFLSSNPFAY